jgi:malate dehydrogenase
MRCQEPAYVESPLYAKQGATYFASNIELGKSGVQKIHEIGKITAEEQKLVDAAIPELVKNIQAGEKFMGVTSAPGKGGEQF